MKLSIRISRTEDSRDKWLSYIIGWMIMGLYLTNAAAVGGGLFVIPTGIMSLLNKIILLFLMILSSNILIIRIKKSQVFYILIMVILFVANYLIFPNTREYQLEVISAYFVTILPVVVVMACIRNFDILLEVMMKISIAVLMLSALVLLVSRGGGNSSYSMGYANSLIIPICCMVYLFFENKKPVYIILAGIGGLNILILGSRGAILAIAVYFMLQLLKRANSSKERNCVLILSTIIILCLVFLGSILSLMESILVNFGFSSRTINLLLSDITHLSGREKIYWMMGEQIKRYPFTIRGIGGEYYVTKGFYAHNFILEVLCDFGVIIGGVLLAVIIVCIIRTIMLKENNAKYSVATLFFSYAIPILCVSSSVWRMVYFWLWGALIINIILEERKHEINI